jgi:glycosyltransferase involved in cell wall biosynthesis
MERDKRSDRIHVAFYTTCLGGGGAEKHLVRVANQMDRSEFQVTIVVNRGGGSYEHEVAPDIRTTNLGVDRSRRAVRPLRRFLREARPDVLCPVMDFPACVAVLATRFLSCRPAVVPSVQAVPSRKSEPQASRSDRVLLFAMKRLYPRVPGMISLSHGVARELEDRIPALRGRIRVIPNAGFGPELGELVNEPLPESPCPGTGPVVVACGRFVEPKGFDVLLRAFARVRAERPDARLWLVGDGPLRSSLEGLARELELGEDVWFTGRRDNPFPFMRAGDLFVLPSRLEAFGNVVVEAMAAGTAVLATDCRYGPGEVIEDGVTGVLVPPQDPVAMASGILRVLAEGEARRRIAEAGRRRAADFGSLRIAREYGRVFREVAAMGRSPGPLD